MASAEQRAREMTDDELIDVVRSMDRVAHPLEARFEGDDDAIVKLMVELKLPQTIVAKALIEGAILRECVHRGLTIPHGNDYSGNGPEAEVRSPGRSR